MTTVLTKALGMRRVFLAVGVAFALGVASAQITTSHGASAPDARGGQAIPVHPVEKFGLIPPVVCRFRWVPGHPTARCVQVYPKPAVVG